jgi:hypothetical protein
MRIWRWYLEHAVGREVDVHGEDAHVLGLRRHLSSSSAAARKNCRQPRGMHACKPCKRTEQLVNCQSAATDWEYQWEGRSGLGREATRADRSWHWQARPLPLLGAVYIRIHPGSSAQRSFFEILFAFSRQDLSGSGRQSFPSPQCLGRIACLPRGPSTWPATSPDSWASGEHLVLALLAGLGAWEGLQHED